MNELLFWAYKDADKWWRLRKVVVEAHYKDGCLAYRGRYFTTLFPQAKHKAIVRRIKRLWILEGEKPECDTPPPAPKAAEVPKK